MRYLILAVLAATLAACTTPQERAIRAQAEVEQMMQVYGPACAKLGYSTSSDPWRDCVLRLNAMEQIDRESSYYLGYGSRHYSMAGRWRPYW